jgi:ABC-type sugar transport system ATPase subunit
VNLFVAQFIGSPATNVVAAGLLHGVGRSGVVAGFRPEHVGAGAGRGDDVRFEARVEVVEFLGDEQLAHLAVKDEPVLAKLPIEQRLNSGDRIELSIPRSKLHLFDEQREQRVES